MVSSRPALLASFFLIGGIVLALYVDFSSQATLALGGGALLLCGALFLFRAPPKIMLPALALLVISLGLARGTASIARTERRVVADFVSKHRMAMAYGQVIEASPDWAARSRLLLQHGVLFAEGDTLSLSSLQLDVRVALPPDSVEVGDWLLAQGGLQLPEDPRIPGQIGHLRQATMEQVAAYMYTGDDAKPLITSSGKTSPARTIHSLRVQILSTLDKELSPQASALCKALLLGDRSGFSQEFRQQIKATGLSHIFALSGLNVGLVVSLVWLLTTALPLPFALRHWLALAATAFYVALGLGIPSLMRAGIMCSLFLVSHLIHRKAHVLNIIGAAAFLELLWRPLDLVDIGFQLSYLAVLGIVLTYVWLKTVTIKIGGFSARARPSLRSLLDVAFATIGAQIGTLPLLAAFFGTIPLLGLLANLVAVPAFAFLLWCEIFLLFANPISHFVSASFAATINLLAGFLHTFVEWFSALPAASLTTGHLSLFALTGIYLGLAIMWFQKRQYEWKRGVLGALVVLNSLVWPEVFQWRRANFEIYFLDVGNGDSILLQTPEKKTMLIDAGPAFDSWDASWRILPALKSLSIDTLDALVLTHTESDHIGGAAALVRDFPIRAVLTSGQSNNTVCFQRMTDEMRSRELQAKPLKAGDLLDALRPFPIWVLSPDSVWKMEGMNLNQRSLVLRVDIGQTSALFAGDIDSVTERRLVPWGDFLRSDLLKVPHHGSKVSSSEAFLKAVHPKEAVITAGRRNPHGHPSSELLERLDGLTISYHITGREGTLLWISDGETIAPTSWRQSTLSRQWHLPTD